MLTVSQRRKEMLYRSHPETCCAQCQPLTIASSGVLIKQINEVWAGARVQHKVITSAKVVCVGKGEVKSSLK